jgi:hypothetical protein
MSQQFLKGALEDIGNKGNILDKRIDCLLNKFKNVS